jgi:hypothetical protein
MHAATRNKPLFGPYRTPQAKRDAGRRRPIAADCVEPKRGKRCRFAAIGSAPRWSRDTY